ncbi:klaroid protein-like [Rhynchophorus ferrugineus]|uniref:klaroid protein-like n=1 Tax=Rhynchophorus ferrugineus TaxID=354439 RepID=UPI003FCE5D57
MSKMELRSSRSRSKTPFVRQDNEVSSGEHEVERTIVRTTRRTTIYKNNEIATSSTDEVFSHHPSQQIKSLPKSEQSVHTKVITSDYSSEEGENEVSSTRVLRQNEVNQFVEQAKTLINGNEMSALELYKKSGRYWEVYPKTDWTYSQHSKDRIEISPGVVAMPNMSRKAIHSLDDFSQQSYRSDSSGGFYSENVAHKNVNTDDLFTRRYSHLENVQNNIFNNNADDFYIKRRFSRWTRIKYTISSSIKSIFSLLYYLYLIQTTVFSIIHRTASKVMLWDTYLMWKSKPGDKATKLILLCLLPLIILSGVWLTSSLGSIVYGFLTNHSSSVTYIPLFSIWSYKPSKNDYNDDNLIRRSYLEELNTQDKEIRSFDAAKQLDNFSPSLSPSDVAAILTHDQLEIIANIIKDSMNLEKTKEIDSNFVENIIQNANFQSMISNYVVENARLIKLENTKNNDKDQSELLKKHELIISNLLKEIEDIKGDISQNNRKNLDQFNRLTLNIKKCCNKKPIVNVSGYISDLLTKMLNNPEFLRNQQGFNDWLKSIFVAKLEMEYYIGNVSSNMDDKITSLIKANSHMIMDQIAAKLAEFNIKHSSNEYSNTVSELSENDIKKVVKNVLAIYDADKTGLVDFAMESMGGQILTTRCTELYHSGKAVVSILGVPLWYPRNSPRTIIRPSIAPGECWAFQNFPGFVVIKLSTKIKLEAFSMEHISRLLVPEGKIDSAPKQFEVYGLQEENDRNPILLGTFTYDYNGDPLQFFPINSFGLIFDMVELRVTSNHGNPNYTCLYRFRVHGQIYHENDR